MLHTALSRDQPPEMRVLCQVSVREEEYVALHCKAAVRAGEMNNTVSVAV